MTHVSGYSRVQVKRLVKAWLEHGKLRPRSSAGNGFARQYTDADQRLTAFWILPMRPPRALLLEELQPFLEDMARSHE